MRYPIDTRDPDTVGSLIRHFGTGPCDMHGGPLWDCATCAKYPGQCQWGACQGQAALRLTYRVAEGRDRGRVVETRDLCAAHAAPPYNRPPPGTVLQDA